MLHPIFAGIMDDFQRGQAAAAKASEAAEREAKRRPAPMREAAPGAKAAHAARRMLAFMEAAERGEIMPGVRASVSRARDMIEGRNNVVWLRAVPGADEHLDAIAADVRIFEGWEL